MAIPEDLIDKIKAIPQKTGVYRMRDIDGNIIYVGKSKNLNARVKSYFNTHHEWSKLKRLVFNIKDIDFIVTDTHLEAQILECALIKKLKPLYNAQFKNDNKYIYFRLNQSNKLSSISMVSEREEEYCYGPFRSKNIVSEMIINLEKIYPIIMEENTFKFTYKTLIKAMNNKQFIENYNSLVRIFLDNNTLQAFVTQIEKNMRTAASKQIFETAGFYRDLLQCFNYVSSYLKENQATEESTIDVILGEKIEEGYKLFFISRHKILSKEKLPVITSEALESFIEKGRLRKDKLKNFSEKRALDFSYIIKSEVNNPEGKVLLYLDLREQVNNLGEFIARLSNC